MTDYLELAAREDADVLLKAERRLAVLRLLSRQEERERPAGDRAAEAGGETARQAGTGDLAEEALEMEAHLPGEAVRARREGAVPAGPVAKVYGEAEELRRLAVPAAGSLWSAVAAARGLEGPERAPAHPETGEGTDAEMRRGAETPQAGDRTEELLQMAEQTEAGALPLLAELAQAERAARAVQTARAVSWNAGTARAGDAAGPSAGTAWRRGATGTAWDPAGPGEPGWRGLPGGAGTGRGGASGWKEAGWESPFGRETVPRSREDMAEEIDRAFQRDARRYDGGFFLY